MKRYLKANAIALAAMFFVRGMVEAYRYVHGIPNPAPLPPLEHYSLHAGIYLALFAGAWRLTK